MRVELGCGFGGGIMTNENISLKRYMQTIWVSCPMAEDPSSEAELFGR